MDTDNETENVNDSQEHEFVTFYIDDMLMGIDIQNVQEINRFNQYTDVPRSPDMVIGVINLRGKVITILDIRTILQLDQTDLNENSRNLVLNVDGETVGLLIDRISDVVTVKSFEIEQAPANLAGIDGKNFHGIYKMDEDLLVILDVEELLRTEEALASSAS